MIIRMIIVIAIVVDSECGWGASRAPCAKDPARGYPFPCLCSPREATAESHTVLHVLVSGLNEAGS